MNQPSNCGCSEREAREKIEREKLEETARHNREHAERMRLIDDPDVDSNESLSWYMP